MTRRPHRLHLPNGELCFWTAQAAELALAAHDSEVAGQFAKARDLWAMVAKLTPANDATRIYCAEHAKEAA